MRKEVFYDGVCYRLSFEDNEFKLLIDSSKSTNALNFIDTNSIGFRFGDVPPDEIFKKTPSGNYLKIFGDVKSFFESVIKNISPYYFFYIANEDSKFNAYNKFGVVISRKYGYYMFVNDNKFSFYKRT